MAPSEHLAVACETQRMELERKMLEYGNSDTCITKLKYMKLKKYLKEICERQKKSLLRNEELLKEFDCIEARIRRFASSSETLQKLKAEYEREIKRKVELQKNSVLEDDEGYDVQRQVVSEARQAGVNTRTAMSRGLYQTATIFMGRQMSAVSSVEDFSAQQKSFPLTKSFSISDPQPYRQPSQSSYVTDSCVVRTNCDLQCSNMSDKIDGKTYPLMGKETPVTSSVSAEDRRTYCFTIEGKTNNCSDNLVESKTYPECKSLLRSRLRPENSTADFQSDTPCKSVEGTLTQSHSMLNEWGSQWPISRAFHPQLPISANNYPDLGDAMQPAEVAQSEDESLDESSDLTVSLSEEDEEMNLLKEQQAFQDVGSQRALKSVTPMPSMLVPQAGQAWSPAMCRSKLVGDCSAYPAIRELLSFEGFCHVLKSIEDYVARAAPEPIALYQSKAANAAELETFRRRCNQTGALEQENLELCEALVLHQLHSLFQSTLNGCLLPEETRNEKSRVLEGKQVRAGWSSDFATMRERLSKHVSFLGKHHVLLKQEVKDLFDTLLICEGNERGDPAAPLLSFPKEYDGTSSASGDEASFGSQTSNSKIEQGKDEQGFGSLAASKQEVTSECAEQPKGKSLLEEIPITDLTIDSDNLKDEKSNRTSSEASFSSEEKRSLFPRDKTQKVMMTTIKSKAFWGDSDDSNSDIEAALRPQVHDSYENEFF